MGRPIKPKKDVVKICQIAEREVGLAKLDGISKKIVHSKIIVSTFREITRDIFCDFDNDITHAINCEYDRYYVIKMCIDTFLKIKLCHIAKCANEKFQTDLIRQKYNKIDLFKGQ